MRVALRQCGQSRRGQARAGQGGEWKRQSLGLCIQLARVALDLHELALQPVHDVLHVRELDDRDDALREPGGRARLKRSPVLLLRAQEHALLAQRAQPGIVRSALDDRIQIQRRLVPFTLRVPDTQRGAAFVEVDQRKRQTGSQLVAIVRRRPSVELGRSTREADTLCEHARHHQ